MIFFPSDKIIINRKFTRKSIFSAKIGLLYRMNTLYGPYKYNVSSKGGKGSCLYFYQVEKDL